MLLGPYEIQGEIGRGGMGTVLRGRSPDGRDVAIKLLRRAGAATDRARFDRERRLLAALGESEGFVPLLFAGEAPEGPYLVMPFVPGGTLRERLGRKRLSVDETLALITPLAQALGRAHERGIVHRDLKPENILFTADGRPLVADLGLAKHWRRDGGTSQSLSREGQLLGTAGYMAPEQMRGARDVTATADVFALGAILHECLAGEPAFPGATPLEILTRAEAGAVDRIHGVPSWLEAVTVRALAREPGDRFPDGHALARALGGSVAGRRSPGLTLTLVVTLVVTVVVVAGGALAIPAWRAARRRSEARAIAARVSAQLDRFQLVPQRDIDLPIELDPENALAFVNRGRMIARRGDYRAALRDCDRAIALEPGNAMAWCGRGFMRERLNDLDGAITDYDRSVALDPKLGMAWASRGGCYATKGDHERAIAEGLHACELDPASATFRSFLAASRQMAGDLRGAVADFDRAIELDATRAPLWAGRASARGELDDQAGAIADATRAVELDPGLVDGWLNRAHQRRKSGDLEGALRDLGTVLTLAARDPRYWGMRGDMLSDKGEHALALADYSRAIELNPGEWRLRIDRAHEKEALGDLEGALSDLATAITLDPKNAMARAERGRIEFAMGRLQEAIGDFDRALELSPDDGPVLGNRGLARARGGEREGAIADLERALTLTLPKASADAFRKRLEQLKIEPR